MPSRIIDPETGEIVDPEDFQALDYNPAMIAQKIFEDAENRDQEEAEAVRKEELEELGACPHGVIVLKQTCAGGRRRVAPIVCSDHTCVPCERRRSVMVRRRWWPIFNQMKSPKFITLTIRDGICLEERIHVFQESFRRLFKMRLGSDNLKKLRSETMVFLRDHVDYHVREGKKTKEGIIPVTAEEAEEDFSRQMQSVDRFIESIEREHTKTGKWPEMRHKIGPGFASLEVTENNDWHVHRHLCTDTQFIPWAFLCASWIYATRGEGQVTWIESVKKDFASLKEMIKYMTKGWEIGEDDEIEDVDQPRITREDKLNELRKALRGKKQIWPLGKAKPAKDTTTCPYCGGDKCKALRLGKADMVGHGDKDGFAYRLYKDDKNQQFIMLREADGRWREAPLIYTPSFCVAPAAPDGSGYADLMAIKARRRAQAAQSSGSYAD